MSADGAEPGGHGSIPSFLRQAFITGLSISLPLLITLVVVIFVVNFIAGLLDPAVIVIQGTIGYTQTLPDLLIAGLALVILLLAILVAGIAAERGYGQGVERRLEVTMAELPGIGTIYTSVDDISDMLMDSDTESFREVRAIEYPFEETYALAFVTAGSTGVVGEATGEDEMVTVFVPMAPNPMGGFLVHVPEERTYEVDLTVEEGVEAVLSTGVTLEADAVADADGADGAESPAIAEGGSGRAQGES